MRGKTGRKEKGEDGSGDEAEMEEELKGKTRAGRDCNDINNTLACHSDHCDYSDCMITLTI